MGAERSKRNAVILSAGEGPRTPGGGEGGGWRGHADWFLGLPRSFSSEVGPPRGYRFAFRERPKIWSLFYRVRGG